MSEGYHLAFGSGVIRTRVRVSWGLDLILAFVTGANVIHSNKTENLIKIGQETRKFQNVELL